MAGEFQYITRQELLNIIALIVSFSGIITGIIMAIVKGTINMKVLSLVKDLENKIEEKHGERFTKLESEVIEVKDNYLSRFERQYEMLTQLRESVVEIKTEMKKDLEYIKSKLK